MPILVTRLSPNPHGQAESRRFARTRKVDPKLCVLRARVRGRDRVRVRARTGTGKDTGTGTGTMIKTGSGLGVGLEASGQAGYSCSTGSP